MNYKLSGKPQLRLFLFVLSTLFYLFHFEGASAQTVLPSMAEEGESYSTAPWQENLPETTIWSYDFSAGIPSTWGNTGFCGYDGTGGYLWNNPFEYRGPSTTPNANVGSRGPYDSYQIPIQSPTRANGFVIFDSDYWRYFFNSGTVQYGVNSFPVHHYAILETPNISLQGYTNVDLNFNQSYRRLVGAFSGSTTSQFPPSSSFIDLSFNNGLSWTKSIELNQVIDANCRTRRDSRITLPLGKYIADFIANYGGSVSSVKIRFRFEGYQYYWALDDISITPTPMNRISFYGKDLGRNPEIDIYNATGSASKSGGFPLLQSRPLQFRARVWNSGTQNLTNTRLIVKIFKGQVVTDSLYSAIVPLITTGDSLVINSLIQNWTPLTSNIHKAVFIVRNANGRWTYPDTIEINNQLPRIAAHFNSRNPQRYGSVGRLNTTLGDGVSIVTGFKLTQPDTVFGLFARLDSRSQPGTRVDWSIHDSTALFNSYSSILSGSYVISTQDSVSRDVQIPFCGSLLLNSEQYFVKLTLNKVSKNHIGIENSMSVIGNGNWRSGWIENSSGQTIIGNGSEFNTPIVGMEFSKLPGVVVPTANDLKLTISGDSVFCAGQSRTLTAPSGYSYLWSNGATTQSISVNSAGNYSCQLSNTSCEFRSDTIHLRVHTPKAFSISAQPSTTFCQGDSTRLFVPFNATKIYSWSNGKTTNAQYVKAGGTYTLTRIDSLGCTKSSSITTTMLTVPTIQISTNGPLAFCPGGSVTLYATAGGSSYLWSNGATSQSITVNATGSYGVSMGLINGCTSRATPVQVVSAAPPASVTASGPLNFCPGGSVTLSAPAGYSYLWSNGATTQSITASTAGSYSVTVSQNGCSSTSAAQVVTVNAGPPSTVSASGPMTFCQGGSVTLSAPAGYSYLWSNGATTQSITPTNSGSYSVVVSVNGCSSTSSAQTVTVNPLPPSTVTASGALTFCQGGSVTLSAPAGYSYLWSTGATTQTLSPSTSGSYSVVVTENGCSSTSAAQVVTINPLPPSTVSASGSLTLCQGGSVTLSAPAGYSYLWNNGATTQSITASASGSYSVMVSANGCSSTSAAQSVTVNPLPPSTVSASGPVTFCQGGSVTLSAPAGYSYLWSNGATTQSITASASGTYSVVVSANGCSSTSAAQSVTVNPLPSSTVSASGPLTFCQGGSVTLSAPAGYSYVWNSGETTQSITASTAGSYSVTVSANGCSSTSAVQTVTVNPLPPSTVSTSGPLAFCQGSSVTLSAPAGYSYLWSTGATTQTISPNTSGSYSVVVSANGCNSTSAAQVVTVHPIPSSSVAVSGPLTFCQGSSVTLSAPAGYSYLWSNGATTQGITATATGSYFVTVSANGCSSTSTAQQVTVHPLPPASVTASGPLTLCQGSSVTLSAPAGYSYLWSNGATTQSIAVSASGSYGVTVSANGCSSNSTSQVVTVNPTPPSNVVASGPLTFCQGGSVALVAPSGYAYVWSNGATTQSINATTSGTFTVTVYGNGCSSTSAPVQVSVIPNPSAVVTASGSLSFCQGGSVTLVAPPGGTYLWSNGAVTQSISVTSAGVYSVVVTANGCSTTSANQQVNVLPVPPATVTASGSLTFCEGGSVGLMAPAGFSYAWSTGATTQSIVASATGAYSVTVSDNTCSATSSPVAVTAVVNNLTPQVFGTTLANVNTIQSYFTSQNLGNGYTWGVQGGSVVTGQGTNAVTVFMGTSGNVKVFVMETNGYCNEVDTLVVKVSGLGMEEEGIQGRLRVYPVPSNGTFTVVPPSTEGILQVVDMVGRLIHQEPITSEKMTIEGVPPGVYTVLTYTNGLRSECRMVVQ